MHQLINKKKIYFYVLTFVFLSNIFNYHQVDALKNKFKILDIKIETNNHQISKLIYFNTKFLIDKNILFLNKRTLQERLYNLKFLESLNVKKKYPSTIKIEAKVTKFLATTFIDKKKYYVGSNGAFILSEKISIKKNLPIIFGKFDATDFLFLKEKLAKNKINDDEILKYYFHKNKRWDLYFKKNIIVQLPNTNISNAIKLYKQFKISNKIISDTVIDLRIQNRLVLNNG